MHVCSANELAHWLHEELWLVEIDGPEVPGIDCIVTTRARLVHEIEGWRIEGAARFAQAARDHAAQLVAAAPPAAQPRLLQYVSDASNHLPRGSTALAAFCSAMAVAWLTGPRTKRTTPDQTAQGARLRDTRARRPGSSVLTPE